MDLVTYLAFDGQCEVAFKHYEKVLGGKILMMMKGSDVPPGVPAPPEGADRIMHARLQVGDRLLMGGDAPSQFFSKPQGFCVNIMTDTPAEAERIFRDLGKGGTVTMPMAETFWAQRFGMLTDKFGTPWMINCEARAAAAETLGKPFVISRTFDAPRERVWQCFTDAALLKQWWGPKGMDVSFSNMDLQPGGTYLYCLRMPNGDSLWGKQVYREIAAPERLVFVQSFSDENAGVTRHPMAPQWPLQTHATYTFAKTGRGKTKFTLSCAPLNASPEESAAFAAGHDSMTQGWGSTLDKLADFLAQA